MRCRLLAVLLVLLGLQTPAAADEERAADASLLKSLGEVAEQYLARASDFSCLELVRWRRFDSGGRRIGWPCPTRLSGVRMKTLGYFGAAESSRYSALRSP